MIGSVGVGVGLLMILFMSFHVMNIAGAGFRFVVIKNSSLGLITTYGI